MEELAVVVFGCSLGRQDQHLVDVLNERPGRRVAVAMVPAPKRELAAAQGEIYDRLAADELVLDSAGKVARDHHVRARPKAKAA